MVHDRLVPPARAWAKMPGVKIVRVPQKLLWVVPLFLVSGALAWHTFIAMNAASANDSVSLNSLECPSKSRKHEALGLPVEVARPHCQQCRAPLIGAPLVLIPRLLHLRSEGGRFVGA